MGVLFVAIVGMLGTRIVLIDRHARVPITEMAALRVTQLFRALPGPALETVAHEARRVEAAPGAVVVRQGDPGSEYFAVISGHLMVSRDGEDRNVLGRGDGFGETALIRDVPRTAISARVTALRGSVVRIRPPALAPVSTPLDADQPRTGARRDQRSPAAVGIGAGQRGSGNPANRVRSTVM